MRSLDTTANEDARTITVTFGKPGNPIHNVCSSCGIAANVLTCLRKFGRSPLQLKFGVSTFHKGICDICGRKEYLTEARDFFYPDFALLLKEMRKWDAKREKKVPKK